MCNGNGTTFDVLYFSCPEAPRLRQTLVVRIARPELLSIWHRGRSHRRPNRSGSPNRRHFASLDLKKHRGQKNRTRKKNKFLGTEVPRNFSDQCSLDFAYFLCLFSGRRAKSSQELCSWELFFLILGGFSPSENTPIFPHRRPTSQDFCRFLCLHFPVISDQANVFSHR